MTELLFQPQSVVDVALIVVNVAVLGYLLSVRRKSAATRWLAASYAAFGVTGVASLLGGALFTDRPATDQAMAATFMVMTGVGTWALVGFAYRFLEDSLAREARRVVAATGVLTAGVLGTVVYPSVVGSGAVGPNLAYTALLIGLGGWATAVLVRKRRRALGRGGPDARRAAEAYGAYAVIYGLFVAFGVIQALAVARVLPDGGLGLVGESVFLGFFFGQAFVYLTYAPEPTSVQAKIVGLGLVTALTAVAAVTAVVFPDFIVPGALRDLPEREALRFVPDGAGGYAVEARPYAPPEPRGEPLGLRDYGVATVPLGFAFPFYGETYTEATVDDDPIVSFGPPLGVFADLRYTATPMVLALGLDVSPRPDGVLLERRPDRATLTWDRAPVDYADGTATVQLTLHADGAIDVVVAEAADGWAVARGIKPDGPLGPALGRTAPLTVGRSAARPGEPLVENYELAYRRAAHDRVRGLVWLALGLSALVLVGLPALFRGTLVAPLRRLQDAARRVDEGDLEAEVPVGVQDEVGFLAARFNRMTASLRRYSREMEGLVAERTAALEAAQARLVQQEKLASLGELTAGIAHEIKNPLNFVTNFADLSVELADEAAVEADPEERAALLSDLRSNVGKIAEHGRRADAIVRAMMEHARSGSGERRTVDLNALVAEYAAHAEHAMRVRHPAFEASLDLRLADDVGEIEAVPQEVGRVLVNLVDNAFDATRQRAGTNGYVPTVVVSTRRADGGVEVRVADNGTGMPSEVAAKVFEPFFTTKPTGEGTGLGLSLAHDIVVRGHGGALDVEAAEGEGAVFVVSLPRRDGPSPAGDALEGRGEGRRSGGAQDA